MRLRFGTFFLLLTACGGSTASSMTEGERGPPATFPDEQVSAAERPTGYVTMLSIEDQLAVLPLFVEKVEQRPTIGKSGACSLGKGGRAEEKEVSAGTLSITAPTRTGAEAFDVLFDRAEGRYEGATFPMPIEAGGVFRVAATGDVTPAFDGEIKAAANVVFDLPDVVVLDASAPSDFVLHWTAEGDNDEVFFDLGIGDTSVTCWFDSKAGEGTVPSSFVAELVKDAPSTCSTPTCMLFLASKRTRTINAGEWDVVLAHGFASIKAVRVAR
jgi:hypothetical protein